MMNEIAMIICLIPLFLAAKKKPVFGQMTLTDDLAVDWVKAGVENKITAARIEFGSALGFTNDYNIPDYHKDKKVVALIYPHNSWMNPLMVTQQSILKPLEAKCCEWEAAGATVETFKSNGAVCGRIIFEENQPTITLFKDKKSAQYAPYEVTFE